MSHQDDKRQHIILPADREHPNRKTTKARALLYDLIARFRKDAREAENAATRATFEFAAETLSGLVGVFKSHEQSQQQAGEAERNGEDDSA